MGRKSRRTKRLAKESKRSLKADRARHSRERWERIKVSSYTRKVKGKKVTVEAHSRRR